MVKWFFKAHKYIGLVAGIFIVFIALSGSLYVFRDDFFESAHKRAIFASSVHANKLPLSQLLDSAQYWLGSTYPVSEIVTHGDSAKNTVFRAYKTNLEGVTYSKYVKCDFLVFINPYDGRVEKVINHKWEFTQVIKNLHGNLLLNPKYGRIVSGIIVGVFLLMLVSGMILWWPRKPFKLGAFKLFMQGSSTAVSVSLHKVLGFYSLFFVLTLAITGMIMLLGWNVFPDSKVKPTSTVEHFNANVINDIEANVWKNYDGAYSVNINLSQLSSGTIPVEIYLFKQNRRAVHHLVFDANTAKVLELISYDDLSVGKSALVASYDVHVGAIAGLPEKLLMLFASLIAAGLPISGFVIWLNRIKQRRLLR